ncbi:hypothetical protein V8B97DRAFT_1872356 [Scleroderma yunnanense]
MSSSIVDVLPMELMIRILSMMDYRTLVTCQQVCRLFDTLITTNSPLQYALELAAAGKEDNPHSSLDYSGKLDTLRKHQAAWRTLQWTDIKDIRMLRGNLWELYGGVLAQSDINDTICFRRLPSRIRGIEERVWSVTTSDLDLCDFTLDPAQDLLILITRPKLRPQSSSENMEIAIHIRSLTTGNRHPLAPDPPVLRHIVDVPALDLSFLVQVCVDRVAVHFMRPEAVPSELVVWNWKTGKLELNVYSFDIRAVSFISEHYLLIGSFGEAGEHATETCLYVLDLRICDSELVAFEDVNYRCAFRCPPCHPWVAPLALQIRADPTSPWTPPASSQVPFFVGQDLRLFIITMYMAIRNEVVQYDLFVLSSALLCLVDELDPDDGRHIFLWKDWGPRNTRLMESPRHSSVWVCFVCGAKFASLATRDNLMNGAPPTLEIWDFTPLSIRRERPLEEGTEIEWHDCDSTPIRGPVFLWNIQTSLPYRVVRRALPEPQLGDSVFIHALCSEDNLILVDARDRNFRVLTF